LGTSSPPDFKWVVAHEMGHVLGFLHEQDQRNSTCNLGRDYSGRGVSLTGYDPSSVMNYCATRNVNNILSALDKQRQRSASGNGPPHPGSRAKDPDPPAGTDPPDDPTSEVCEPSSNINPGVRASEAGGALGTFQLRNQCPNALRVAWLDYQGGERP